MLYLNYMDTTHHGWQAITHCLSPTMSLTDPGRQENCRCPKINISKHLHHRRKDSVWHADIQDKNSGGDRGQDQTMPAENYCEKGGTIKIVCWLCLFLNYDAKLSKILGAVMSRQKSLSWIKKSNWFNLFVHAGLKKCAPAVRNFSWCLDYQYYLE